MPDILNVKIDKEIEYQYNIEIKRKQNKTIGEENEEKTNSHYRFR